MFIQAKFKEKVTKETLTELNTDPLNLITNEKAKGKFKITI
jgi:hypothetical protein